MDKVVHIGPEAQVDVSVANQKITIAVAYAGADLSAGLQISCTVDQLVAALAKAIPGDSTAEQMALQALRMGLNAING